MDARNAIEKGQRLRTANRVEVTRGQFNEEGQAEKPLDAAAPVHLELDGRNEAGACVGVIILTADAALALATQIRLMLTNSL